VDAGLQGRGQTFALVSWLIVPMALSYAATQPFLNLHLFSDYLVVVVPPVCLLAGLGIAVLPW
jgi:hypothetical protein